MCVCVTQHGLPVTHKPSITAANTTQTSHKHRLGFGIVGALKVALIIVYYFNATDNPKTQWRLDVKKCVVQNVTQLFLLHLQFVT